jgi:hypothetical protein
MSTPQWEHGWFLCHDNAPANKALSDQKVLAKRELQWFLNHPTALVSPSRLFSCSQNSRKTTTAVNQNFCRIIRGMLGKNGTAI